MILKRDEFINHFSKILKESPLSDNSPLWIPETNSREKSQFFIETKPITSVTNRKFWEWCDYTLRGQVLCYSSSDDYESEWWGFTDHRDIPLFILRWSCHLK